MSFAARLEAELAQFKQDGVYKRLNYLEAPQSARTRMQGRGEVVILSSNNYLGLCSAPEVVAAGKRALDEFGAGTGSVRFICGTFTIHRELEQALARFVGCESSLTYVSCWNANEGLVPTLLGERSEEHTSELQSPCNLVCRLLLEKKKHCMGKDPPRDHHYRGDT